MKLSVILIAIAIVMVNAEEKNRGKRQQVYYTRRGGRPPPYAVQMEPIVQYSQRDPLYNPLASAKSDEDFYHDETLGHPPGPYGSEPEPIIEIIIKESNESLPTSAPPVLPATKPAKEPIQVYYVKYEKKDQGNGKSKVVYEKPVPALTPHEEHEEIKSENQLTEKTEYVTQSPLLNEPSTTLRAIIRPDSEVYHSDGSGIKITFGSDKVPPNNHNKRSDRDNPNGHPQLYLNSFSPSAIGNKRPVGQFPAIQANHRLPQSQVTFPQQRITSFPQHQHQHQQQQQLPPNFSQPQFQSPPLINVQRQQQRPAITIQGLPEVQQRFAFQSFNSPSHGIRINHPQQPGFPPAVSVSHQSLHLQNQPHFSGQNNFNGEQIHSQRFQQQHQQQQHQQQQQQHQQVYKQDQDKKYQELKQREQFRQQEIQRQQEQQFQERQRQQLEQQRLKQQETKIREQYNQQQQQQQQQQANFNRIQHQQRHQQQIQQQL